VEAAELLAARRVLAVQPHYDDNDIGAGGTLAALAAAGAEIHYLTVTDDLAGVLDPALPDAEATARLRAEQAEAGQAIGVHAQHWLGFPDAGPWEAHALRGRVVEWIRRLSPNLLFTVDPWLPNEAHGDHLRTGFAVAEAALLYRLPRVRTDPAVDAAYLPHELTAVVLYYTREPSLVFDVSGSRARKHRALDAYRAQFTPESLSALHAGLEQVERAWARERGFSHGEALRVLRPGQLHCDIVPRGG
jgi:LmbE family N-acetylglucosaminyl deacetylase